MSKNNHRAKQKQKKTTTKKIIALDDSMSCRSDTYELSMDEAVSGKIWVLVKKPSFPSLRNVRITSVVQGAGSGDLFCIHFIVAFVWILA